MDLLLTADQKVEPGWVCGPEGLQQSGDVIRWRQEKHSAKMKFRCFRNKELQAMIRLNPDLRRAPWFKSIPDLTKDEFLLLLVYRVTGRRFGVKAESHIHEVLVGSAANLIFVPYSRIELGQKIDRLECALKEDLPVWNGYVYMKHFTFYGDFIKSVFVNGVMHCNEITSKAFDYVMNLGYDSKCLPILAHIITPVASETSSVSKHKLEDLQISNRQKISSEQVRGPITRSQSKGDPNASNPISGSQMNQLELGSEIPKKRSQPSHHTTAVTNEQIPVASYSLGSADLGSSQSCKCTQLQDQAISAEDASTGLRNPRASMSPVSQGPCASSTDFHEKLETSDTVNPSSSEAVFNNDKTTFSSSPDTPNSSSHYTTLNANTITSHPISATTVTVISVSTTTPSNSDTRTTPVPTNTSKNVKPLQHPTKSGTSIEIISDTKKPLPPPGAPQHSGTISSSGDSTQRLMEAISHPSYKHLTKITSLSEGQGTESSITSSSATISDTNNESFRAVTSTLDIQTTSTSSQNVRPFISSSSKKDTTVPQNMITNTSARHGNPILSSPSTRIPTSEFIKRTSSTLDIKNTTTAEDLKTTMLTQSTTTVTSSQNTRVVDTTQEIKTGTTFQDKTARSSQHKTTKIVNLTQDIKTDRTLQDKKTANSSEDKTAEIVGTTHDTKTDRTPQDKMTANSSQDRPAEIANSTWDIKTDRTPQDKKTVNSSQQKTTKIVNKTHDTKTDRTPQDKKTVNSFQEKTAEIVDTTHNTKTNITPQDKKTVNSSWDKTAKITDLTQDIKTDRTPQDKKTANSSEDKTAEIVDLTQDVKINKIPQDKKTANSSEDKTAEIVDSTPDIKTNRTPQDQKTASSSEDKNAEMVDLTQGIKTDRAPQDEKTANSSRDQTATSAKASKTTNITQNKNIANSSQDNKTAGEASRKRAHSVKFLKPLPLTSCCEAKDDNCGIKRKNFGQVPATTRNKTILLLGAKGSGKTCLVNAMANFIMDVENDSEKWTVSDEAVKTGGFSSTENITGYTFVIKEKENEDLSLTLIDTPGLNDSSGNEVRDHVESLKTFLANAAHKELKIHAIALVVQAHLVRLTSSERLVMDHLKTLFGHDVSGHVVNLITFADNQSKPPVVEALNQYGMSTKHCFKFNNSVFCGPSDENEKELDRVYWKTSHKSWKKCWKVVKDLGPLKTNIMKSIQKEVYATNMRDAAVQELQEEVKALQKIYKDPYGEQVEERRQRVWDMARVVHRTLQMTSSLVYPSFWCLIEDVVCNINAGNEQKSKEIIEFLLAGSPMQLKDAVVAILESSYKLQSMLESIEKHAKNATVGKVKNNKIKEILFSTNQNCEGAFPQAKKLSISNTAKAIEDLINDHISNSSLEVVDYLNCLEKEVKPNLRGMIKEVNNYLYSSKLSQQR